jgi:hypothetical protein
MADSAAAQPYRVTSRPPAEDSDDEDKENLVSLGAEYDDRAYYDEAAKPSAAQKCAHERLPISRLEQRELRHDVQHVPRKCTDCLCVVLYALFCLAWLAVAVAAILFGNYWSLTHGRDYAGRLCGWDEGVEEKPLVAYPRLNKDLMEFGLELGLDILDVSKIDLSDLSLEQLFSINVTGICVEACPVIGEVICSFEFLSTHGGQEPPFEEVIQCNNGDPFSSEYLLGLFLNIFSAENSFLCSNCWVAPLNSSEIFNRCLDIIYTETTTTEECVFPVNTSIAADDPNCQTKKVVKVETSVEPAYENPIAAFFGTVVATVTGWCVRACVCTCRRAPRGRALLLLAAPRRRCPTLCFLMTTSLSMCLPYCHRFFILFVLTALTVSPPPPPSPFCAGRRARSCRGT